MKPYKFSIIIPAYNEEVLISKTLARLFEDNSLNNIELLVICNACEDKTHFEVISFIKENALLLKKNKIDLSVLETVKASKTNALNMGINNSQGFVKVLMDADIQICGKDINILVDELYIKKLKAVSPQIEFSFDNSNFLVRQYYRVASLSFYNIHSRLSNVIALSEDGIKRVSPLPEVIADDEYIRRQFTPNEVAVSQHCSLIFICAKNLTNLLQVLTRVERGNIQLKRRYSALTTNSKNGYNQPPVLCLPTFFLIKLFAKIKARLQFFQGKINQWERDESNRIS
jgi:glycosyltransferase involved in cell wall biosynthesis